MPPRERQKLQPRNPDVLGNVSDRYYRAGNVEGMKRIGQELQDRMQNHPSLRPGTGGIFNTTPMEGGSIDPRSFWNVQAPQQPRNNSGVMAAMAGNPMVQQAKSLYKQVDPWIPNMDFGNNEMGYSFEKPMFGGTLGYGMDYDWDDEDVGAFINWQLKLGA